MAVYKSLRTLIACNRITDLSRSFLTFSLSSPPLYPASPHLLSPPLHSRFLSPLSKWITPFHSPLFLSSPPWMLSQSSTPIYFQSDVVSLPPKVQALNYLLRRRKFPINLTLLNRTIGKELGALEIGVHRGGGKFSENFVNLPNLISISRLISGPFLGWMIVNEMYLPAFIGLAISGATDWLDGFVARRMGINSVIGSYLDPLADKVNTVLQLVLVAAALLQPELGTPETQAYITYLSWLVGATTVATTAAYGTQYMRSRAMVKIMNQ